MFIGLSTPIYDFKQKDKIIGLLLASIKLEDLGIWLTKTEWINSGFATLLNNQGRILKHKNEQLLLTKDCIPPPLYRDLDLTSQLFHQDKPGFEENFRDPVDGKKYLVFYSRVGKTAPYNTWGVLIQHEHAEVVKPVNNLQSQMISWGVSC